MTAIALTEVSKVFTTDKVRTHAVSGVSLTVAKGEFVAITGPSGCGKSTLLSLMGLIAPPSTGRIEIGGKAVSDLGVWTRRRVRTENIGFIFQAFNLIDELSSLENIALPLRYRGYDEKQRRQLAMECLDRVELSHRADHFPSQLSGGQQQRIAIARALATKPPILLADEPTGNLDGKNREIVLGLLEDINRAGSAVVIVTHDEELAERAHRRIALREGRITTAPAVEAA